MSFGVLLKLPNSTKLLGILLLCTFMAGQRLHILVPGVGVDFGEDPIGVGYAVVEAVQGGAHVDW